jgi:hypothetical protein
MKHVIDEIFDNEGRHIAFLDLHTDKVEWNMVIDPNDPTKKVHLIDRLVWLHQNPDKLAGTGFEHPSTHPDHKGRTRFEAYLHSIQANNDKDALDAHGIQP